MGSPVGFLHWEKRDWEELEVWESWDCPRHRFGGRGFFLRFLGMYLARYFLPFTSPICSWLCVCQRQIPDFHEQLILQKLLLELSCRSVDEKKIAFPLRMSIPLH